MRRPIFLILAILSTGLGSRADAVVQTTPDSTSQVRAYPNPWRSDTAIRGSIQFDQLPANSTIKIFTLSGEWVRTLVSDASGVAWDLTNNQGSKVASGVYLYTVSSPGTSHVARGKLGVIR